jgi:hypothetical protein
MLLPYTVLLLSATDAVDDVVGTTYRLDYVDPSPDCLSPLI